MYSSDFVGWCWWYRVISNARTGIPDVQGGWARVCVECVREGWGGEVSTNANGRSIQRYRALNTHTYTDTPTKPNTLTHT